MSMSKHHYETITCPACGAKDEIPRWESINNKLSPNEANELLYGNLFEFTCPSCGSSTELCYPCLFHDMERHAMIQYVPDATQAGKTAADLDKLFEHGPLQHMVDEAGYRCRIVFSHNDLREKARIFHDGLDDRAIEIIKLAVEAMALEGTDDDAPLLVFYDRREQDGGLRFVILAEEVMVSTIPLPAYEDLLPPPNDMPNNREYVIDKNWALEHYHAVIGNK